MSDTAKQIGRLAMRVEGRQWNAYYALEDTMKGAVFLGSIAMTGVVGHPDRKQAFMDLMKEMVADILEERTGARPEFVGEREAPEHERGGNA